jgi:outer membrane protein OmpA-like peptidoglycan-associated protein
VPLVAVLLALGLAGCSTMERLNPFGDDSDTTTTPDTNQLSTDEPYPNLADVPGRPVRPPAVDRTKIAQGLIADRENAQYTEEVLRRAPEAPAPRPVAARQPAAPANPPPSQASSPAPSRPSAAASAPPSPPASPAPSPEAGAAASVAPSVPPSPRAPAPVVAAAPPPPEPTPAPVVAAALPPPQPAPPPSAAPAPVAAPPPAPAVESAPAPAAAPVAVETAAAPVAPAPSAYAAPADVPLDPSKPSVQMVNNEPVVSPGFYATQPPPPAAAATPPVAPPTPVAAAQFDPLRTVMSTLPPPPAPAPAEAKESPTDAARGETVVRRTAEAEPAPPPAAPVDVAPIPNQTPNAVAALPPGGGATTSSAQLDAALQREFPATGAGASPPPSLPPTGFRSDALTATIYFADGSAGLSEDDRAILREVGQLYRQRRGGVRVIGYASADARGADTVARRLANFDLASRRADAVSRELARTGVPAGSITTGAEGTPTAPGVGGAGYGAAGDRRVDIYLDY